MINETFVALAAATAALAISPTILAKSTYAVTPTPAIAPPYPAVLPVAVVDTSVLRTGTEVALKLSEALTTKKKQVRVGQRFHLAVAEEVLVDGRVAIPAGSPAMGEGTDVRNKGMWGKSGHLGAQLLYVQVNGRKIRLMGTFDDKGVTGTAGAVAAIAFVPVVGFFTTGTSAEFPLGGAVKGFIGEDVPLAFARPTPEPLQIAASPAVLPVPAVAEQATTSTPAAATVKLTQ